MAKTYEQIETERQSRIDKAIKHKDFRQTKTELNINFSWAVNNSNNFLKEKDKGTAKGFRLIKKWYPEFISLYRDWAMENLPIEPAQKLTKEDFVQAKVEAPESQAMAETAEDLAGREKIEEANKELEEATTTEIPEEIPTINE